MCGIGGFVVAGARLPEAIAEARLGAMLAALRHRGPDDEGVWSDGRAGLVHSRLAIIDLSPAARQPMSSADGTVRISYNGEVYNFAEIRRDLEALGYAFRSRSDSEVIVNGWHAWGARIFDRLRGMFALALWDQRSGRLILARDRVGKKPLYYAHVDHAQGGAALLFGSEAKALLVWPGMRREADLGAIDRYLSLGYVPAPGSAFAGVRKLPAAHYLVVPVRADGQLGEPECVRYWRLPEPRAAAREKPADLAAELVARLEEAVRLRLVSDVPLGAFLSGGVDSSAVVAMMARVGGGRVKTFTIGFSAKAYDETRYARMVAERYGTDHEEFVVEPDSVAVLPRLVWHYGEPFADPSAVPTYYVAQMARRRVTVALNGDGGDECFLGYRRYQAMHQLVRLDRGPGWGRSALARMLALAPPAAERRFKLARIGDILRAPEDDPAQRYAATLACFADRDKAAGYGEALQTRRAGSAFDLFAPCFETAGGLVAGANRADIHTYLPDDLMVKVDVAGMAHGLEPRSPLLDHVLLGWAAALPPSLKMARGATKALFKTAMEPYLPRPVLTRPKRGFGAPIDEWFRSALKELAYDTLLSQSARERGLFRADYVRGLLDEHCGRVCDHHTRLWALLMLELWYRMWIDSPAESAVLRPAA